MLPVWGSFRLVFGRLEPNYRRILYSLTLGAHFAVALGYWLFDEMPPAQEMNRQWNEAAAMVEPIRQLASRGGIRASQEDFWYVLEYQPMDRFGPKDRMSHCPPTPAGSCSSRTKMSPKDLSYALNRGDIASLLAK